MRTHENCLYSVYSIQLSRRPSCGGCFHMIQLLHRSLKDCQCHHRSEAAVTALKHRQTGFAVKAFIGMGCSS